MQPIELTLDVNDILDDYIGDHSHMIDEKSLKTILTRLGAELQIEESISTVLLAMKSSQSKAFAKHAVGGKATQQDHHTDARSNKCKLIDNSRRQSAVTSLRFSDKNDTVDDASKNDGDFIRFCSSIMAL